jgi:hypothetical protein
MGFTCFGSMCLSELVLQLQRMPATRDKMVAHPPLSCTALLSSAMRTFASAGKCPVLPFQLPMLMPAMQSCSQTF